ncbi:MAG: SGNH/GDSL hydrolase family protein [Planctomycetota bacterium]
MFRLLASTNQVILAAALLLPSAVAAQEQGTATKQNRPKSKELPFQPKDGETVVFLGDSITHQCQYTQYIEDFFFTRYPQRKITFHNAGVSGDKASDALVRFDQDVASHRPDYVTILLGMNDGQYQDYDSEIFAEYERGMNEIVERITSIGAKPIVLSPTMFDHGQVNRRKDDETWRFRTKEFSSKYNALMAFYGGWLLEQAASRDVAYVNLWGPLNEHTILGRRGNPAFTLVGDAIHPQGSGQMVMAFEFLSQLGVERSSASSIVITMRQGRPISRQVENLDFDIETKEMSFTHKASSLPWVVPEDDTSRPMKWGLPNDARVGYAITKAGHKLSADRLKIVGLPAGQYEVAIDGKPIGQWSHAALGTKIEIQENQKTPQYQQALRIAQLNQKRNDECVRPMRDKWSTIKGLRRRYADKPELLKKNLAKVHAVLAELSSASHRFQQEIYEEAQPVERNWTIRPVAQTPKRNQRRQARGK